jgi:hypothetical protein
MLYMLWVSWFVIPIGQWTDTASTKCIYEHVRQSGTSFCPDPSVRWRCHFHSQLCSMPMCCCWHSYVFRTRAVCTAHFWRPRYHSAWGSPRCRRRRQHSSRGAVQSTWCCTRRTARRLHVSVPRAALRHLWPVIWLRSWRNRNRCVLSTDEVRPSHDGVSNTVLLCGQMRTLTPVESNFTLCSGVCLGDQLFGTFIFEGRPTGGAYPWFLQDELPGLLEDVPLIDEVVCTANTTEFLICYVKSSSERSFPWAIVGRGSGHHWPSRCAALPYWIIVYGEIRKAICVAETHFGCGRPHKGQWATAAMSSTRYSQPSGLALRLGCRWDFWKPVSSTGQYKLKTISWSYVKFKL